MVELSVDVVVVGGGIAGVSVASELAESRSVLLVEAEPELAYHTTGRSAAVYLENYGTDAFRQLTLASRSFFVDPPSELVDGPLTSPLPLLAVGGPDDAEPLAALAERGRAMVPSIRQLDRSETMERCPILRSELVGGSVYEPDSFGLDVGAIHQAYVRGLRARGGIIKTASPVTELRPRGTGWSVRAGNLEIGTDIVVNAAGAWGDRLASLAGVSPIGLQPLRRTAFVARVEPGVVEGLPLVHEEGGSWYLRPEGPNVLCSPADETPSEPCDAKPEEIDVARCLELINGATTLELRSVIRAWAGLRTFAPDRDPVVGFDPVVRGFFWLVGQGGTGIQSAPAMARLGAALVRGEPVPDDLTQLGFLETTVSPERFG